MYQVKHKGIRGQMSAQHSARCTILPPYGGYAYIGTWRHVYFSTFGKINDRCMCAYTPRHRLRSKTIILQYYYDGLYIYIYCCFYYGIFVCTREHDKLSGYVIKIYFSENRV